MLTQQFFSLINHSTNQSTRIIRIYFIDVLMHPTSIVKNERKKMLGVKVIKRVES